MVMAEQGSRRRNRSNSIMQSFQVAREKSWEETLNFGQRTQFYIYLGLPYAKVVARMLHLSDEEKSAPCRQELLAHAHFRLRPTPRSTAQPCGVVAGRGVFHEVL